MYSENALVTILMCSYIDAKKGGYRPFTALEWSNLVLKIIKTELKKPASLLGLDTKELCDKLTIDIEEAERIKKLLSRGSNMAFILEALDRKGIKIITRSDEKYPGRLKTLLKKQAPPLFYYSGNLELLKYNSIAVVGSRNIDVEGNNFASELAQKASEQNLAVVSGGAKGVDSISEESALKNNGVAISIIADSLSKKIKKKNIRDAIIQGRLLVMSANNPDAPFSAGNAMNRNKYVYALSNAAFIIASDYNKGGTWAGAVENLKNDWVKSFVYNSDKYYGNLELVKKGGVPVSDLKDIVLIDLINSNKNKFEQMNVFEFANEVKTNKIKSSEGISIENQGIDIKAKYDLYYCFKENLRKILVEPKSLEELMYLFKTNKSQTLNWINRAIDEGIIIKHVRPVRYLLKR